eukprot:s988_g16.t1
MTPVAIPVAMVRLYILCGMGLNRIQSRLAETVLGEMLQCRLSPDVFSYSALSSAWAKKGDAVKASEVLSAMAQHRLVPNQHVYGAAIHACNRSRDAVRATKLLQRMSEESVKPNVVCFSSAICACAKVGAGWSVGSAVFVLAVRLGMVSDAAEAENLFTAAGHAGAFAPAQCLQLRRGDPRALRRRRRGQRLAAAAGDARGAAADHVGDAAAFAEAGHGQGAVAW